MTVERSVPGIPEPPSAIGHIWNWAKERSTWYTRVFSIILIITLSAKWGHDFLVGSAPDTSKNFDYWSDKAFILLGFWSLLIGVVLREFLVSRKERYANIFDRTEAIAAELRDLNTYLSAIDDDAISDKDQFQKIVSNELTSVLDNIAELFSMVTGTTCRVALKCAFTEDNKVFVYAITRDRQSNRQNIVKDRERFKNREDQLIDNEDFYSVFHEEKRWYIEHNLARKRDYRNSSFKVYGSPSISLGPVLSLVFPDWGWTLPYKSAMVFPVQQRESENLSFDSWGCIGFLAIDSAFGRVFKTRFDGPLGASFANALFAPLARYVALLDQTGAKGITHVQKS